MKWHVDSPNSHVVVIFADSEGHNAAAMDVQNFPLFCDLKERPGWQWRQLWRMTPNWQRTYQFATDQSFQYPTFQEYQGSIFLSVTQGDSSEDRKERIMFGRLSDTLNQVPNSRGGKAKQEHRVAFMSAREGQSPLSTTLSMSESDVSQLCWQ